MPDAYDPFAPPPVDPTNALAQVVAPTPDSTVMTATAVDPAHPLSFVGPNGHIADMAGFHAALRSWRGDRPQFTYDPTTDASRQAQRMDWRTSMQDWRGQRPDKHTWGQSPTPLPPTDVGMVPGVPGSMGTNPNGNTGIVPPGMGGSPVPGANGLAPGQMPMAQGQGWRGPRYRGA